MAKTLHFKTNTLLKNLVGKDLINDDNIAVIELVKNAYDARANAVEVNFASFDEDGFTSGQSTLQIYDDGKGMTETDLNDKWLNIAYSEKKNARAEHGNPYAGNKGVGRFSCDRLGEELNLFTRSAGSTLLHLRIHWPDFEKEDEKDLTIQQIPMSLSVATDSDVRKKIGRTFPQTGTVLLISTLRSSWDRNKLLDLRRQLERFMNPNQLFTKATFSISLNAPDLADDRSDPQDRVNGAVENQIFKKLQFAATYIDVRIDKAGKRITTELFHEGEPVFRLVEKNEIGLKNVRGVIYFLNSYKKAYFKRQTGLRSIDFGSIFLFLNGFRIAPYGDRGNDWLGIDSRQTQGRTRYLGGRDLIGRIEVEDDEAYFKPISSREGLVNTPAFVVLRETFALEILRRLERFVVDGLDWDSIPDSLRNEVRREEGLDWNETAEQYSESRQKKRNRIALSIMSFANISPDRTISFWFNPSLLEELHEQRAEDLAGLFGKIDAFGGSQIDASVKKGVSQLKRLVKRREEQAREAQAQVADLNVRVVEQGKQLHLANRKAKAYEAQKLFLESTTSLDTKRLMAYHHEIALNASIVNNYVSKCVGLLRSEAKPAALMTALEKISLANKRILAIAQFATKANFKSATQKEPTDVPAFVEQYIVNVARDFVASGLALDVVNEVKEPFEIKLRRIELSILVDNLISNAGKAHGQHMVVTLRLSKPNILQMDFQDDGRGLSSEVPSPENIFELGFTTTSGSGLGLYHAKSIVEALGGTIRVLKNKDRGVTFRIEVMR